MSLNAYQKVYVAFFVFLVIFWTVLFLNGVRGTFYNYIYAFLYGLMPLVGGIAAMRGYRTWGGMSTILGRAILLMGLGLFFWGCGESIYAYYNLFSGARIPHPSIADIFFAPSILLYALGTILLSMTTGARFGLKQVSGKAFAVVAPVVILVLSYFLLIKIGKGGNITDKSTLQTILNVLYPLIDALSLAVSVVVAGLSFKYMGGRYKLDIIFILAGLIAIFAADSFFAYTTTIGTAFSGGISDLLYTIAVFLLTCGLLGFNKLKNNPVIV
jgi:hypothetical protein